MNKKSFLITTIILGGILAIGSFSSAYALFIQSATNANFGISQEVDYYLKGSFNSWNQDIAYKFVNNTAGMSAEVNKIKEYKLENVPLDKDEELKVWASTDSWFQDGTNNCTYEHRWSDAISYSDGDHNYTVPMTSNTYSFYLKFYSDGSSKVYITANKDILYFIPSNHWKEASATMAIIRCDNDNNEVDTISDSVESPAGTFKFSLGTTYSKYKFARLDPSDDHPWNTSKVQTIGNSDINNCFALWDEYYGGGAVWGDWNAVGGDSNGVSCGAWSAK